MCIHQCSYEDRIQSSEPKSINSRFMNLRNELSIHIENIFYLAMAEAISFVAYTFLCIANVLATSEVFQSNPGIKFRLSILQNQG